MFIILNHISLWSAIYYGPTVQSFRRAMIVLSSRVSMTGLISSRHNGRCTVYKHYQQMDGESHKVILCWEHRKSNNISINMDKEFMQDIESHLIFKSRTFISMTTGRFMTSCAFRTTEEWSQWLEAVWLCLRIYNALVLKTHHISIDIAFCH